MKSGESGTAEFRSGHNQSPRPAVRSPDLRMNRLTKLGRSSPDTWAALACSRRPCRTRRSSARAVGAPAAGLSGIGERGLAGRLLGLVLAPDLAEAEEVALRLGVAVDLVVDRLALRGKRIQQRQPGDAQAAVVGRVFAQRELAVEVLRGRVAVRRAASKPPYSATSQSVRSTNALRSSGVCHSRRLPLPSYFEPSSSKPWVISWPMTTPMPPKLTAGQW
jgi:hypothetical protein